MRWPGAGIQRGRRLLDGCEPCVEWGYLELSRLACDRPDIEDLERSAAQALEIARRFGDVGLEMRALADSGLALVTQGRLAEGFERLDEALATMSAGEVEDAAMVSIVVVLGARAPAIGPATSTGRGRRSAWSKGRCGERWRVGRGCSVPIARSPSGAFCVRRGVGATAKRRCWRRSGPRSR